MNRIVKILLVEDDPKITKVIEHVLRKEGYQVVHVWDVPAALEAVERERFDMILLDLGLPRVDGFEVCRRVRARGDTPIMVISARTEEVDKVVGFSLGIDDYLTKPFSPTEMALRVRAILRRTQTDRTAPHATDRIARGSLAIDKISRTVTVRSAPVTLTSKEFDLLWVLASNPNQVFTRDQLAERIWDSDYVGEANSITVMVRRLREKIEENPGDPKLLRTVWGVGYKFVYDIEPW
ncbi:MAG: response regulator transcription factor [Actinobacteria bacterium]|nr:response regulator transcription factor [Actinomycetota bacterium]